MSYCQGCAFLSKKLEELEKYKCYILSPTNNPSENVAEYVTRLEAKLEKAVEALREIVKSYSEHDPWDDCPPISNEMNAIAENALKNIGEAR